MRDRTRELDMLNEILQILERGHYEKSSRRVNLKLSRREMEEIHVYLPDGVRKYSHNEDPGWFRKYIAMHWKDDSPDNVQGDMTLGEFVQSPGFYEMSKALRAGEVF